MHVLQNAVGGYAKFIVGVCVAHENFESARAAAAFELDQLLNVPLENLSRKTQTVHSGRELRHSSMNSRMDVHFGVGFTQRFDFGGLFLTADRIGVHGLERDFGRGFLVLNQFRDRIRIEAKLELGKSIGLHHAKVGALRLWRGLARGSLQQ